MRWSPPPNSDRSPLTYHVNYTGISRSTSDTTLTLTGLHPYEEYSISVQAGNEGGLSVPVAGTARTYSDSELVVWTCVVESKHHTPCTTHAHVHTYTKFGVSVHMTVLIGPC